MLRLSRIAPGLVAALLVGLAAAEPPAATAPAREKLDYLFESWRGQPEETLKTVWGRPDSLAERETSRTYQFDREKRGPAVGFGGVRVFGRDTTLCRAYFQIGLEDIVTRATWRGPDAGDCWALFRESAPPTAAP